MKAAKSNYPLIDIIRNRFSPRIFSQETLTDDELFTLFEAARWAPSSNNLQPWRFIYARKDSPMWNKMFDLLAPFNKKWVGNATVLVLTAIKTKANGKEQYHALHDLGLSVATLSLQAQSMGIAVHQMGGFDHERAAQVYKIPDIYHFATAIAIGKYGGEITDLEDEELIDEEQGERSRKDLSEILNEGSWSEKF